MPEKNDKKSLLEILKGTFSSGTSSGGKKKRVDFLIIAGILLLMGIIYFSGNGNKPQDNTPTNDNASVGINESSEAADEEQRLKQVLSCIQGAGQVEVMITYESTPEKIPAVNKDTQVSTTNDDMSGGNRTQSSQRSTDSTVTVQSSGATEPLIVTQKRPKVIGVIVVAQGAYDFNVRMNLLNAVHTALNVPVEIIDVFTMEQATSNNE